ncbi:MAG: hypothetical protein WC876_01760 [Candidatus Thermoplasmatota archaeon]|jgi:hypothetical protein
MENAEQCSFDGCPEEADSGSLCDGHRKQKEKGLPLTPLRDWGRTPKQVLIDAAIDLGTCDSEASGDSTYKSLEHYVLICAVRYTMSTPKGKRMLEALKREEAKESEHSKRMKGATA